MKYIRLALMVLSITYSLAYAQPFKGEWKWGDNIASPKNGTWFLADGVSKACTPVSTETIKTADDLWTQRGNPVNRRITELGAVLIIYQGNDKVSMAYTSDRDCLAWLPAAIRIDAKTR
jgi:hypothetical protein